MAGDWIKMRKELADDPAVIAIAAATDLDDFGVVGRLHKLWAWADSQTTDGNASCVTGALALSWIDRYVSRTGFAQALINVGWLAIDADGIHFPDFGRHNGETAKKRALAAKRVSRARQSSREHVDCCANSNADVNAPVNGSVAQEALQKANQRREEKRREEKRIDETRRDDHLDSCLSKPWLPEFCDAVRAAANRLFRDVVRPATDADRDLLLKVAALVVEGGLAENAAVDAVEAVRRRQPPPDNPVAYFQTVLAENAAKAGEPIERLLARVTVPPELIARRRAAGAAAP